MKENNKIGLALSGGGYRAATYHIGTFKALKKLGILDRISVLSTNSGGSIAGACYSLNHNNFEKFEQILLGGVQKSIIGKVLSNPRFFIPALALFTIFIFSIFLLFTNFAWINLITGPSLAILILYAQFEIFPISRIIEEIYDELFFKKAKLSDLSNNFQTTINSTNISTGRIFHFSQDKMSDSSYEFRSTKESIKFKESQFPIARAVMASSCVPFAFTPVKIAKEYFENPVHFNEVKPRLVDGGVYDNQGIHKLTFLSSSSYCKNVIVSDAGTELPFKESYRNMFTLLIRTSSVFMARIKNFQMMNSLYRPPKPSDSSVAYQSLGFNLDQSMGEFMMMLEKGYLSDEVISAHNIPEQLLINENWEEIERLISEKLNIQHLVNQGCNPDELNTARSVGTNLTPLKIEETKALIKHAEAITELQIKLFLPQILQ